MTQLADRPAGTDENLTAVAENVALGAQPLTMVQALNRALHDAMVTDQRVLVFGEDVSVEGGVFRVTEGLAAAFGESRCFDTPLAESAIIGIAAGWRCAASCRCPRFSSTAFPTRRSTRSSATWPSTAPAPAARSTCR